MDAKLLHTTVGVLAFLVFLFTGVYMEARFPDIYVHDEAIRYQFRANHVYILMAALVNLTVALRKPAGKLWQKRMAGAATLLILLSPVLFVAAFFREPALGLAQRPLTLYGAISLLAGVLLAQLSAVELRKRARN